MNKHAANGVLGDGEPDPRLQYVCSSCDTDYIDEDTFCCGKPVDMYAELGCNTPHEEWELANLILDRAAVEEQLKRHDARIEDLQQGTRW